MNKINEVGVRLLEYKDELLKDYPKIVKDSLLLSLEQMLSDKVIDLTTYEIIKNTAESKDGFTSYLLTRKEFTKTYEELFEEYEVLRNDLDEELRMHELFDLRTETIVEKDSIYILKTFLIDENFVMDYFGVQEIDLIKLMKRKGFVENFVALRLTKILNDIVNKTKYGTSLLNYDSSLVYFNENYNGYNIDLIMEVKISDIPILEKKNMILAEIKNTKALSEEIYRNKMQI